MWTTIDAIVHIALALRARGLLLDDGPQEAARGECDGVDRIAGQDAEVDARAVAGGALFIELPRSLILELFLFGLGQKRLQKERRESDPQSKPGGDTSQMSLSYLPLVIGHRTPLGGCQDTLLGGLSFIAKDLSDQAWIRTDALEEHKVRAERLLRRIGVLDVSLARFARLALGRPERIFALDVIRSERAHGRRMLPFPRLSGGLRAASVGLQSSRTDQQLNY